MAEDDSVFVMSGRPRTSTFQMRISPEAKARLEEIYAECGMTMTDAVNIFFQQTLNCRGMPLAVSGRGGMTREQAEAIFMAEIQKGLDSVRDESDWIPLEEMLSKLEADDEGQDIS